MRKFEEVRSEFLKHPETPTIKPERASVHSAGYDFKSKEEYTLQPGESHVFWTDIKATMFFDNVLKIYTRSGNGTKRGIILRNNVGIIDSDYYSNPNNDGNIGICLVNTGTEAFTIHIGDRIAQGVFEKYLITDDDIFLNTGVESAVRNGGFGSSGK